MSRQLVQAKGVTQPPLAGRNGVAPSRVWLPEGPWLYVGEFLLQRFPHLDRAQMLRRIGDGEIVDGQGQAVHYYTPYRPQQWLWYYRRAENEVAVPFAMPILYADDYLVAVDKPHFLPSIPSGQYLEHTAVARVRKHFNNYDITPLHRLDRETAGVMLFCVQPRYRGVYQALFQSQDIQKEYEAVARVPAEVQFPLQVQRRLEGVPGQFLMQCVEGAPNSDTYIELLRQWSVGAEKSQLGHFRLQPLTGRKHQLRVHMQSLGAPIINDPWYADGSLSGAGTEPSKEAHQRAEFEHPLQLLARSIAFIDPLNREYREFRSERTLQWASL
ncbi:MAG TPA: pseudouridine synthase [Paenalcaligenes sp.]|nr:pseudouridine synthase [Paenalcaligenes sp.]